MLPSITADLHPRKQPAPMSIAGVLAVIEKLCGGLAGWQHLQKKAGAK
jgi:hypothetical protein